MGVNVSRTDDLTQNDYVARFYGTEPITPNDPFWNRFLAFNIALPNNSIDQSALDLQLEPIGSRLLVNNNESNNIASLVRVFVVRVGELLAATNTDDNLFAWQTFNALFALRCVLKYIAENADEELMVRYVEGPTNKQNDVTTVNTLIAALMGVIVDVPLKDLNYYVHLESITSLLAMLAVSVNRVTEDSYIYRIMMRGRPAKNAPSFVGALIRNFVEIRAPPPLLQGNNGNSVVLGIAAELWSFLTFGRAKRYQDGYDEHGSRVDYERAPLSVQSLLLLLVLVNSSTQADQQNPYRSVLFACGNDRAAASSKSQSTAVLKLDFDAILEALRKRGNSECATLILYLLVHRNTAFRAYLLASNRLDALVVPILKTLYNAPSSNSHHIYMSLIVLLILSEDEAFNRAVHETILKNITWYTERPLTEVTLGGLLVLVVIRTIQYNMIKMRDKYLHTNCLAALANMSAHFRNLHPYVSQRLVSLFETLAKRYLKLKRSTSKEKDDSGKSEDSNVISDVKVDVGVSTHNKEDRIEMGNGTIGVAYEDEPAAIDDAVVLEEVIRMVLEILNSCLTNGLVWNPNLVYTLLYKRHVFVPFRDTRAFGDIVRNLDVVIDYFGSLLERRTDEVDARHVLEVIRNGSKCWPKEKITKFADLKFKYVEEERPEEFFVPYVWNLIATYSIIRCDATGLSQMLNMAFLC